MFRGLETLRIENRRGTMRRISKLKVELGKRCAVTTRAKGTHPNTRTREFKGEFVAEHPRFFLFKHDNTCLEAFLRADFLSGDKTIRYLGRE